MGFSWVVSLKCGVDSDVFVRTSVIGFYGKCNEVGCSRKLFDEMPQRSVVSWTAMVVGYVSSVDLVEARRLFDEMPRRNSVAWNAMIDGFVKSGDWSEARRVFDSMPEKNVVSFTTMIDGYSNSGDMASAGFLFDRAPDRDLFAWSALISGYAQNGQLNETMSVFADMSSSNNVEPDEYVVTSLISASSKEGNSEIAKWVDDYATNKSTIDLGRAHHVAAALVYMKAKCGNVGRAKILFEQMPKRDLVSYCSMIQGLSIHGRGKEAVELFNRMVINEGLAPDEVACSRAGLVAEGLSYFDSLRNKYSIVPSLDHYSCVVDLLSRSGDLKSVPVETHGSAWCALLGACRLHGDTELGELVAAWLLETEPQSSGNYVLFYQIYAERERWFDVSLFRDKMKEKGVRKVPGRSWINSGY